MHGNAHGDTQWDMRMRVAALVVIGAFAVAGCQAASGESFQHSFNQPIVLDNEPVGQTFRPVTGRVAGVDVLVATFDVPVDQSGRLRATLRDGIDGPVLARASLDGAALGNDEWVPVRFREPVPAPQVAAFEVTWDGATPLAVWANAPLDEPDQAALLNDPYVGGELLLDGEPAVGDLAFRVVGSGEPADVAANLGHILRQGAARLADQPLFGVLWLLAVAGAVGLGVKGLRGPAGELGQRRGDQQRREHQQARP